MKKEIDEERLKKEFKVTGSALEKVKIAVPENSHLRKAAEDFLDMAERYFSDAKHFMQSGDWASAFGALNYAHAWLDAGARLGLFEVDRKSGLFVVD